ncbi:hypothetical protein FMUND_8843 [Fusarium mundagurra]|uniref:Uncharacterized protein n=1 Tax=Fusarium mundagurra TaxID=1567541 RepID=A0A8H6DE18_9HYPO|nr:hypothetical protein FMUND_8843 [Fusarium mundagurra]
MVVPSPGATAEISDSVDPSARLQERCLSQRARLDVGEIRAYAKRFKLDKGSRVDEKLGLAERKPVLLGEKISLVERAFVPTKSESVMKTLQDLPSSDFATTCPDLGFANNSATTTQETRAFGIVIILPCP